MTKHYRERFHLDINTAIRDLQEIEKAYDNLDYRHVENQFEDFYEEEDYLGITDRLLMCIMEENDFDDYLKVLKDTMPKVAQKGEMKKYFIQGARESYNDMFQTDQLSIGIWTRTDFDFCGYCMLKHIDTNTPEIGIDLRKKYRRKHIGLESLTELLTFAKENYEVDHFIYSVDTENMNYRNLGKCRIRSYLV